MATALSDAADVATYTGNLAELALDREQWAEAERLAHAKRAVAIFTELRSSDLGDAQGVLAECQAQTGA
jgi:hypothetical protein